MSMSTKRSEDIQPGDVIVSMGNPHLIASTDTLNGFGWPVATSSDGWAYTLCPGQMVEVA